MKKVLLSVVAATAMATALPALAQPYGNAWGHPSNRGYDRGYSNWTPMQHRVDRLNERIERGLYNGQLTRREAQRLRHRLFELVRMERHFARDGLSPWERAELDRRFDQLRMEIRFERRDDDRRWDRDFDDDRRGRRGY